jgi:hypothetical protein
MRMVCVPREQIERCVTAAGLRIVRTDERDRGGVRSLTFYATPSR